MARWAQGLVLVLSVSFPASIYGNGLGFLRPRPMTTYYYPIPSMPVLVYPLYPMCVAPLPPAQAPQPARPGASYAAPTAAPPSAGPSTPEPPLAEPATPAKSADGTAERGPGFGETATFYDTYSLAPPPGSKAGEEQHTVDFWNLTDRDLTLRIEDGSTQVIPRARHVALRVGRQFTWHIEGRQPQTTRFEPGEAALQIVIRR